MSQSSGVLEIITMWIGQTFHDEPERYAKGWEGIKAQKGAGRQTYGITMEDPTVNKWLINWDNHETLDAFIDGPNFKPFLDVVIPLVRTPSKLIRIDMSPFPPTAALQGPVVEITSSTTKPGTDKAVFAKAYQGLCDACLAHPACKGAAWGWQKEDPSTAWIIVSWTSKEAHLNEFRETEGFKEAVAKVIPMVASHTLCHIEPKYYD